MTDETPANLDPPSADDETVLISTADAAKFHDINPRTVRKWIDAGRLEAQKIGTTYWVPVSRAELLAKGLNPDEMGRSADPDPVPNDRPVPARQGPTSAPAVPNLDPLTETIRELARRNVELAAAEAEARGLVELAQLRADVAEARSLAAQESAANATRDAIERAERAERALDTLTQLQAQIDPRPWWKKLFG